MGSIKNKKILALQSWRALAFLGILCSHTSLLGLGAWGADFFFALSGFLLTYQYWNKKEELFSLNIVGRVMFAAHKVKKIYVLHVLTMFAYSFLDLYEQYVDGEIQLKSMIRNWIFHLLLIHSWTSNESIYKSCNGVDWFLSVIIFLYFCYPGILFLMSKYREKNTPLYIIAISFLIQIVYLLAIEKYSSKLTYYSYVFPLYRFLEFWIGCNIGYSYEKGCCFLKNYNLGEISAVLLLVISVCMQYYVPSSVLPDVIKDSALYTIPSAFIIYVFAFEKGIISKILNEKILIYIGDISGYAYLIHTVVIFYSYAVYYKIFKRQAGNSVFFTVLMLILTIIATQIYIQLKKLHMSKKNNRKKY